MVKRKLKRKLLNILKVFLFSIIFLVSVYCFLLAFFPKNLSFGFFQINTNSITLGEIGSFIAGIFSPLGLLIIYLTLKLQQDQFQNFQQERLNDMLESIQRKQPKFSFIYKSFDYEEENFELTFIFSIINIGKEAIDFVVTSESHQDEENLINFLNSSSINYISNIRDGNESMLKLTFNNVSKDAFTQKTTMRMFCSYLDSDLADRAFYAIFEIIPFHKKEDSVLSYKARFQQIDRAI